MKKGYYDYVGIYTFSYAAIGVLTPLIGQYLDSIGFTGMQIGMITSSATVMGMFASPFWGTVFHKDKKYNGTLTVFFLCIMAAMIVLGLIPIKQFEIFLSIYVILSFFQVPVMPLADALILDADHPFGCARKWGAIGFALGVLISGQIAQFFGLSIIFPLYSVAFIITGLILLNVIRKRHGKNTSFEFSNSVPICEKQSKKNSKIVNDTAKTKHRANHGSYLTLLKNKKLMALLMCAFFVCGTTVANNVYFGFLYTDAGGTLAGIGVAFLLMVGSEAPFMAWSDKLASKFTLEKTILFSMIVSAARFLWYSTAPPHWMLLGLFFLQGMVNGIILVEFVRYIAKLVHPKMIGMAMALYQAFSSNLSTIICQLFGGMIIDQYSSAGVYLFFGIYNIVGILLYLAFGLQKEYLE